MLTPAGEASTALPQLQSQHVSHGVMTRSLPRAPRAEALCSVLNAAAPYLPVMCGRENAELGRCTARAFRREPDLFEWSSFKPRAL